jgi:hypothetical protein
MKETNSKFQSIPSRQNQYSPNNSEKPTVQSHRRLRSTKKEKKIKIKGRKEV